MPGERMHTVVRRLRSAIGGAMLDAGLSDGALLERYLAQRDDAAFTALVRRHGPMVLGVCRRVLRDAHDADDAFQATFLVLVRKAQTVFPRERVGPWLYGVAYRTSLKAKAMSLRRRAKQKVLRDLPGQPASPDTEWLALLDREIHRLPDKYRLAVVLCDLEGKTRKQAARQLGWPEGTVATRLQHGRALVQKRLLRHGLPCSAGAITLAWAEATSAASVRASLASATIQTASLFSAGKVAGLVPLKIIALAQGVLQAMVLTKIKNASAMLLLLGVLGLTVSGLTGVSQSIAGDDPPTVVATSPQEPAPPARTAVRERSEGRLPTGPAPLQALVSLDKDEVVVRTNQCAYVPRTVFRGNEGVTTYEAMNVLRADRYDRTKVEVFDTRRRKLDNKDMAKWLKEEIPALVLFGTREIDPLHLRLIKDGTLIFVLPVQTAPVIAVPPMLPDGSLEYAPPPVRGWPQTAPAAPVESDVIVSHQRKLTIPIHVPEKHRGQLRELVLYYSTDKGHTWQKVGAIPATQTSFGLNAPADGTYWLRVATVDRSGKQEPADIAKGSPDMKILIDTRSVPPPAMAVPQAAPVNSYAPAPLPPPTAPVDGRIEQAERDMAIAEFYLKTGHRGSASLYYELIQKRYAGTTYAQRAARLLQELRAEERPSRTAEKPALLVGQILIVGNNRVPDATIREALELYPGQVLDYKQVRAAEERLRGLKDLVNASPIVNMRPVVSVIESHGDSPYRDILVTVNESLRLDVLAELEKLDGTWVVTSASVDGKDVPHLRDGEMVFRGDRMTSHLSKNSPGGRSTITLDPAANPKTIRFTPIDGPTGATPSSGTYEISGDTLKLTIGAGPGGDVKRHAMELTLKRKVGELIPGTAETRQSVSTRDLEIDPSKARFTLESRSKSLTISADTMTIEPDGRVKLTDCTIVPGVRYADRSPSVIRGDQVFLRLDRVIKHVSELTVGHIESIETVGRDGTRSESIKIESKSKLWAIKASALSFEADGRVRLTEAQITRRGPDQKTQIMRGSRIVLTFDGPVRTLADFESRQIVSIQAEGGETFTTTTN
jgi:RNA polymerase sigma factor (sigma-70 family)